MGKTRMVRVTTRQVKRVLAEILADLEGTFAPLYAQIEKVHNYSGKGWEWVSAESDHRALIRVRLSGFKSIMAQVQPDQLTRGELINVYNLYLAVTNACMSIEAAHSDKISAWIVYFYTPPMADGAQALGKIISAQNTRAMGRRLRTTVVDEIDLAAGSKVSFPVLATVSSEIDVLVKQLGATWARVNDKLLDGDDHYFMERIAKEYLIEAWAVYAGINPASPSKLRARDLLRQQLETLATQVAEVDQRSDAHHIAALESQAKFLNDRNRQLQLARPALGKG